MPYAGETPPRTKQGSIMASDAKRLDGPRLGPASNGPAQQLVVFLHGFGANGADLIDIGYEWRSLLPHAAFTSPHAPEACPANPYGGWQWFGLTIRNPGGFPPGFSPSSFDINDVLDAQELWSGVNRAAPSLNAFLDQELSALGLDDGSLALVGFSQGAMMALHAGLRRLKAPAAIVGYSGLLVGPEHLSSQIRVRPPVFLAHGDRDELIPPLALTAAREELAAAGVSVEWHISEFLGHGIDAEGLKLGGEFLAAQFGGQ
jgi:phospholipase/carboxylesterase